MATLQTLACVALLVRGNLDAYINGTNVCSEIGQVSNRYCTADEVVLPPGYQKIVDLVDERLSTGLNKILQIKNRAEEEVDELHAKLEQLLKKLPSKARTTIISPPKESTITLPGTIEPPTVAVSRDTAGATVATSPNTTIPTTPIPIETSATSATSTANTEAITTTEKQETTTAGTGLPENCDMVCDDVISGKTPNDPIGFATTGTSQRIFPKFNHDEGLMVYCDCKNDSEGAWTVFQRRMDGSVDFYRNWANYSEGFGNVSGEFWLGLEAVANLTSGGEYALRVDLEDWSGNKRFAEYRDFSVSNGTTNYTLTVGSYSGNAGDSLGTHNGKQFSTKDLQNGLGGDCARFFYGAWWFHACYESHLNAFYFKKDQEVTYPPYGIGWNAWISHYDTLMTTEMKFRPAAKVADGNE